MAAFAIGVSTDGVDPLHAKKHQRVAIVGELPTRDLLARYLLFFGNRDRLNDENVSRFHHIPSVCAETCRARAAVWVA